MSLTIRFNICGPMPLDMEVVYELVEYSAQRWDPRAGWYVHPDVDPERVFPEWRLPGGGVSRDAMHKKLGAALGECLSLIDARLLRLQRHRDRVALALQTWEHHCGGSES